METNGSLLTEEIAKFLNKNNVKILASMDGPHDIHDSMRVYHNGESTFQDVLAWYEIAKQNGCTVAISIVYHSNVAKNINRVIDYLGDELKASSMGLDLLHIIEGNQETN